MLNFYHTLPICFYAVAIEMYLKEHFDINLQFCYKLTVQCCISILFLIFTLNCRKPAVVIKHTAVNEPESADEREQDSVADNPTDGTIDMEEIPEGECSYMDV